MSGAAVVENELSNANGAGVDGPKDFTPKALASNEYADGLAKGKFAFWEADENPLKLFDNFGISTFSLLEETLSSAKAADTTKSPRKTA